MLQGDRLQRGLHYRGRCRCYPYRVCHPLQVLARPHVEGAEAASTLASYPDADASFCSVGSETRFSPGSKSVSAYWPTVLSRAPIGSAVV